MSLAVSTNENIFCFDDITVDAENFRVQKNGRNIVLTPRAFDVLIFLIKNAGRTVEKQEIFDAVWKNIFVSDNALTKVVKEIRHALEDSADNPRYIETVPKRGYRFTGKITEFSGLTPREFEDFTFEPQIIAEERNELDEKFVQLSHQTASRHFKISKNALILLFAVLISISALAAWVTLRQSSVPPPTALHSIAVLPFKPVNTDSRDESLEMGMAETLITRFSNLRQVTVRPISAVRKYTDLQQDPVKAGQELQVETILDGSIQKSGERIRVTARLINVRDNEPLWSEQFDENFTDIFKVQDSIAERITNALTLRLSRQEKEQLAKHLTDDADAYQLYLRGQLIWNGRRQNWIEQSLAYYQKALEKDPNFALAHVGVAESYMMLSGHRMMSMQEAESKARPSIVKALEIDNNLAQAHNAMGELKYQYEYDWKGAEKEFKRALELNPNVAWIRQAYGWFLMTEGRLDDAATEMDKARELDPSSLTINVGRGRLFYFSRQYDQAIQYFKNIIAVEPNEASSYYALYNIYEQKKMYPEAIEVFLKNMSLNGAPPRRIEDVRETFRTSGWEGLLQKQFERMKNMPKTERVYPYGMVQLYLRLGQKDEAFFWLEKAFEEHDTAILQLKIEPAYDILRDDPRYAKLLRKIGLEP